MNAAHRKQILSWSYGSVQERDNQRAGNIEDIYYLY
jgi:hypothetical protein